MFFCGTSEEEGQSDQGPRHISGVLEILPEGFGFLRFVGEIGNPPQNRVYVSPSQIRRFGLKEGDQVVGRLRARKDGERYDALYTVESVNGRPLR